MGDIIKRKNAIGQKGGNISIVNGMIRIFENRTNFEGEMSIIGI